MASARNIVVSVITRLVVCVALLGIGASVFAFLLSTRPEPQRRAVVDEARRVVVMQAEPVDVRRQFEGYGTATAMNASDVPARVSATVIERTDEIRPGNLVRQGQVLVRLDPSDFERQVDIAANTITDLTAQLERLAIEEKAWMERVALVENEVKLARDEFDRVNEARQREAAKQREVEIAELAWLRVQRSLVDMREELSKVPAARLRLEAQKSAQEASLALAKQDLERCTVVSPLDGVLQAVDVDLGENVAVGQRIARVVSLRRIEVPLRIAASARPYLEIGDEVRLESAGSARQSWVATVSRIAPEDDEATRSMTAYVELAQDDTSAALLSPGKFVRASVTSAQVATRWVVPRRAMRNDRILLVEDGRIAGRRIEVDFQVQQTIAALGLPDDLWVVLSEDTPLSPQALVVVTPSRTLVEGLPVEPVLATGHPAAALTTRELSK